MPRVSTQLTWQDYIGAIKVRWGIGRNRYTVQPGLYKVGNPNSNSDVFVSANYKLSFDHLRKNLESLDAWILVIDTKGINVWCAAGKGTFGTENLLQSIKNTSLPNIVKHRRIIVPQLGAVGVAAYKVKKDSGFKVIYGPIQAKHINAFIQAGYKANTSMRTVSFPMLDRARLIPADLSMSISKLLIALALIFVTSGLDRTGFIFEKMIHKKAQIITIDNCMECCACARNCETGAITVQSGVGCATGILYGILNNTEPSCDCTTTNNSNYC